MSYTYDVVETGEVTWAGTAIEINLGTRDGFVIAAAMRGPDLLGVDKLKLALTARFRFLATGVACSKQLGGYSVNAEPVSRRDEDVAPLRAEVIQLMASGYFNVTHYLTHIKEGANALAALFATAEPDRAEEARRLVNLAAHLRHVAITNIDKAEADDR